MIRKINLKNTGQKFTMSKYSLAFNIWSFTLLCVLGASDVFAANLTGVDYFALPGDRVRVVLKTDGLDAEPTHFVTTNPSRLALDFAGMNMTLPVKTTDIGVGMVSTVTALEAGGKTRVVFNLVAETAYDIRTKGNDVVVTVGSGGAGIQVAQDAKKVARNESAQVSRKLIPGKKGIENIDFRRGDQGEGRIIVTLSNPRTIGDVREQGGRVLLSFANTKIPADLQHKLDVLDFATPVKTISTRQVEDDVEMEVLPVGDYEYLAYQADNIYTLEFRPLTKVEKELKELRNKTFKGDRLSLNFQNIDVRNVLQLLADFTDLNLVASDTVRGSITLRLKNVPWDQAMDIILKTKGLSMRKNDNVILVAPTEEIAAREKLELESMQQVEELALLHSEFIEVNYAKASDLASLLKSGDNRLMSERGQVSVDERTNMLLVQDTNAKLEDIRRLVAILDVPVRQVLIESRIVIANNNFSRDLGVRFGLSTGYTKGKKYGSISGGKPGYLGNTAGNQPGVESPAGSGQEALLVNLPATLGGDRGGAFNLLVGRLGNFLLQLEITAMQVEGRGELISSPRVITSDQNEAFIQQGVEIPYQEASSSGATSVSFKEAVLELKVTPHITPDDRVIMDLAVKKDNPDFGRAIGGVPPVDTREVQTSVLIDNGETVVLGGVFERDKSTSTEKIPFFGDLPYLGYLFKQEANTDDNRELLIFVTPKILVTTQRTLSKIPAH
ncbi:MAG: type IV pilus secretin PilQ [gamma proteobacterium symbiont of Bathyaustriella thionipta]|nr:type IV pilus secretin PilQ [gamma proteobacterium symbiont of Bathyaustriella thionipta]